MQTVTKDTEQQLYQKLKESWETFPQYRCVQLKFSQSTPEREDWFKTLSHELRSQLDEKLVQAYLCHDNDVFILTRTMTQKRLSELLSHLTPKLTPALTSPGLASLFEIGVDWPKLRQICKKKIENLELLTTKNAQKKNEALDKVSKKQALNELNADLIKSLGERRHNRDEPMIMVVEDDPFSQKMVHNALKGKYPVSMSADGAGALMSYVRNAPDVLFLDIGLPDINGHEVLERLFKIDPHAYVVMFSGNGDKENILKAVGLGAKGFVGKPFTQEKLIDYIEKSPFIQTKQTEKANGYFVS